MSNLKSQGTKAFIWDFTGKMAIHGMGFIISIFLARLLNPSDFGLIAMVMVIISIATIFTDIGLGSALIQRRHLVPIHYSSVFFFNITIGILLTVITYLSAPFIASFFNNNALIALIEIISFLFVINAFSAVQSTKLRKELNYALLTKIAFISSIISGIVGITLAFNGAGVWSLVSQSLTQAIVYNIIIWLMSDWKPKAEFSIKALMQLWAFGFRMFLSNLLNLTFGKLDTLIIAKLFEPATLGYFNRAKSLDQMVITYSSGSLMSVLFPILSKVQNNLERFQHIIMKSLGILTFVVFFLLGSLYLISHELVIILFGEKWLQTIEYFKILVLSGFGFPISALLVNVLSSRGNSKSFLRLEIYKKIIFGINLSVGFIWGIEGYLYGLLFATLLGVYLNIIFVSKEIDIEKFKLLKPILIQMIIAILITLFVQFINKDIALGNFIMLALKGIEYTFIYLFINKFIDTNSYRYFMDEAKPIYTKLLIRIKR